MREIADVHRELYDESARAVRRQHPAEDRALPRGAGRRGRRRLAGARALREQAEEALGASRLLFDAHDGVRGAGGRRRRDRAARLVRAVHVSVQRARLARAGAPRAATRRTAFPPRCRSSDGRGTTRSCWRPGSRWSRRLQADLRFAQKLADVADAITLARFRALDLRVDSEARPHAGLRRRPRRRAGDPRARRGVRARRARPRRGVRRRRRRLEVDRRPDRRDAVIRARDPGLGDAARARAGGRGRASGSCRRPRWGGAGGRRDGDGAFADGRRCRVSEIARLEDAVVSTTSQRGMPAGWTEIVERSWSNRGYGDFWQYCLVADGVVDLACDPVRPPLGLRRRAVDRGGSRRRVLDVHRQPPGGRRHLRRVERRAARGGAPPARAFLGGGRFEFWVWPGSDPAAPADRPRRRTPCSAGEQRRAGRRRARVQHAGRREDHERRDRRCSRSRTTRGLPASHTCSRAVRSGGCTSLPHNGARRSRRSQRETAVRRDARAAHDAGCTSARSAR